MYATLPRKPTLRVFLLTFAIAIAVTTFVSRPPVTAQDRPLPEAWGSDHVGKRLPNYMTGDECLFCHREVGNTWQSNWHNRSMVNVHLVSGETEALLDMPELADIATDATYLLGGRRMVRFLRPNGKYGQFAIHETRATPPIPPDNTWTIPHHEDPAWNDALFADRCAGCHTTAVETELRAFAAPSLDCFVCHGDVPPGHQGDPALALFSGLARPDPRVEISTCGQCHLRGGESVSTGLPYPNQFVPGDNLFLDFNVDWSDANIEEMNPGDAHIYRNVREVLVEGKIELTCTTCHTIHEQSSRKHRVLRRLQRYDYCAICHDDPEDYTSFIDYERHSAVCQY